MKLIILDKDGTLTTPKSGKKFVQHPEDQILLPGVLDALKRNDSQEHILAIASNQGGIAAGRKTRDDAIAEMKYCIDLSEQIIHLAFFCPDYAGDEMVAAGSDQEVPRNHVGYSIEEWAEYLSPRFPSQPIAQGKGFFRKPGPGMLLFAMYHYDVSPQDCLMVGDRPEDEQAAQAAGVAFQSADRWREPRK